MQVATLEAALAERQQECGKLGGRLTRLSAVVKQLKANAQRDTAVLRQQVLVMPCLRNSPRMKLSHRSGSLGTLARIRAEHIMYPISSSESPEYFRAGSCLAATAEP